MIDKILIDESSDRSERYLFRLSGYESENFCWGTLFVYTKVRLDYGKINHSLMYETHFHFSSMENYTHLKLEAKKIQLAYLRKHDANS